MYASLSNSLDRFATVAVLGAMLAGLPLAGLMLVLNSGVA